MEKFTDKDYKRIRETNPELLERWKVKKKWRVIKNTTESYRPGCCPECGSPLAFEEGCLKCYTCGYSECG